MQKYNLKKNFFQTFKALVAISIMLLVVGLVAVSIPQTVTSFRLFVGMIICTMAMSLIMMIAVNSAPPSKSQVSSIIFLLFNFLYLLGILVEITGSTLDVVCVAIKLEYFSLCGALIGVTWFISNFINVKIPQFVYVIQYVISIVMIIVIWGIGSNQLFYQSIKLDYLGPYPRAITQNGPFFYAFYGYLLIIIFELIHLCIFRLRKSKGINRIRIYYVLCGICCPCITMFIRSTGLANGFDTSNIGIFAEIVCFFFAFIKYGYFNSIDATNENVLKHGHAGILVVDSDHNLLFQNDAFQAIFTASDRDRDTKINDIVERAIEHKSIQYECQNKIYEITADELEECNYVQGYMLWINDMTEHYTYLKQIEELATTDGLTGLNNRIAYEEKIMNHMKVGATGAFIMMDIDNFKSINDRNGHAYGDLVLKCLGKVIASIVGPDHFACRIGGDEFSIFFRDITKKTELSQKIILLSNEFEKTLVQEKLPATCLSFGIAISMDFKEPKSFEVLYREADKALYLSKNNGKNQFYFYKN